MGIFFYKYCTEVLSFCQYKIKLNLSPYLFTIHDHLPISFHIVGLPLLKISHGVWDIL